MKFTHTHSAGERRGQWGVALLSVVVVLLVGVLVQCLGCGWGVRWVWGAALPEGLPLLRVWRSTSNLFAVIAVRANTLESSNSLFYFSHHEGDHLSSRPPARLHFQPSRPLASGPLPPAARNMSSHRRVCTQRHKPSMATFFFIFFASGFDASHLYQARHCMTAAEDMSTRGRDFFLFHFYEVLVTISTARWLKR